MEDPDTDKRIQTPGGDVSAQPGRIQEAIDACAQQGGGTVSIPPGLHPSGTLTLRSNVCLYLEAGARVVAAPDAGQFPTVCESSHGHAIRTLLWADDVENITVAGPGTLDGGCPGPLAPAEARTLHTRTTLVLFRNCRHVRFLDVTLRDADKWSLHLEQCDDVMVRGVTIRNNVRRINSDGIDPDGCRNVIISDCNIRAGDDCICIKSTRGRACENVTVSNCILSTTCTALKIGTESRGDIRNILFNNCVIHDTNVALALYLKDGGTYENMLFSNMSIEAASQFPILVDHTPRNFRNPRKGSIRSIAFENLIVRSPGRCLVEGLPDRPIEDISFRNVTWRVTGPLEADGVRKPAGARMTMPDPDAVNHANRPYAFIAAHCEGLTIDGWQLHDERVPPQPADRGMLSLNGVRRARIRNVRCRPAPAGVEPVRLEDCADVDADDYRGQPSK